MGFENKIPFLLALLRNETLLKSCELSNYPPASCFLDARAPHLPPELHRAHTELDRAVERCYRAAQFTSDRERVEFLFRLYEQATAPLLPATPAARGRRQSTAAATPRPRRGRTPGLPGH